MQNILSEHETQALFQNLLHCTDEHWCLRQHDTVSEMETTLLIIQIVLLSAPGTTQLTTINLQFHLDISALVIGYN